MDGDPVQDQADWFAREALQDEESDASDHDSGVVLSYSPASRCTPGGEGPCEPGMVDGGVLLAQPAPGLPSCTANPLCESASHNNHCLGLLTGLQQDEKETAARIRDLCRSAAQSQMHKSEYPRPNSGIGEGVVVRVQLLPHTSGCVSYTHPHRYTHYCIHLNTHTYTHTYTPHTRAHTHTFVYTQHSCSF